MSNVLPALTLLLFSVLLPARSLYADEWILPSDPQRRDRFGRAVALHSGLALIGTRDGEGAGFQRGV